MSRRPAALALLALLATLLAPESRAQQLRRVRVPAPSPEALQSRLAALGFDVLHGSDVAGTLELVVDADGEAELRRLRLDPELVELGRPLRDKLAERGERIVTAADVAAAAGDGGADGLLPAGYSDLAGIEAQMAALAAGRPDICQVIDLTARYGTPETFEGRHLLAARISDNVATDEDEPALLVVAAHHCREIVTPVIALDTIARLLAGHGSDPGITALVDGHEIWIAPVWNPDGYQHCWDSDALWRKNRRVFPTGVGVDVNRNYPFGWSNPCSGSTVPSSLTYKGPSAASEAETQTMLAFAAERNFAKVLDYHSSGREVLWGYACMSHALDAFLQAEAVALSLASGYGGASRPPSADGEHYEWELGLLGAHAFLTETALTFQPTFASAQAEAALVWPGTRWLLERPISITGNVTDACTNLPLEADVTVSGLAHANGEQNRSGGPFGRYHLTLPAGNHTLQVDAPGHVPASVPATVTAGGSLELDVALAPLVPAGCWTDLGFALAGTLGPPAASAMGTLQGGDPVTVRLAGALPSAPAYLVVSLTRLDFSPFYGGTLVPDPDPLGLIVVDVTGADGELQYTAGWPVGLPSGFEIFLQWWIADGGAPFGFAGSNALAGVTP